MLDRALLVAVEAADLIGSEINSNKNVMKKSDKIVVPEIIY